MKLLYGLSLASALLLATQCTQDNVMPPSKVEIPSNVADRTTAFAFNFWNKLDKEEGNSTNYFASPLSLHMALGMLLNGADGKTKQEMEQVLQTNDLSMAQLNDVYQKLITKLPQADPAVKLSLANSIWQSKSFGVEKSFVDVLKNSFSATHCLEDFGDQATVGKMNKWANDHTNGKIPKVIDEISPSEVLFLMNALYFKGNWTHKFDPKATTKTPFQGIKGNKEVDMMYKTHDFAYAEAEQYRAVELPYANEQFAMTVLLPNEGVSIAKMVASLTPSSWENLNKQLMKQKVVVGLPKFKLNYTKELTNVLKSLGMPSAFSTAADLSKISPPAGKIKVSRVKQDAFLAIDEVGTEAAAVTTIGVELTSVPMYKEVICDRPFLFVIREKTSNTVLFFGRLVDVPTN